MVDSPMSLHLRWCNWVLQGVGTRGRLCRAEAHTRLKVLGFYVWLAANLALLTLHALSGLWLLRALHHRLDHERAK
jgi:hypothetical protein